MRVSYLGHPPQPTVLIETDQDASILALKQALLRLIEGRPPVAISIDGIPGVELQGLAEFVLESVTPSERRLPAIRAVGAGGLGPKLRWSGDSADWLSRALLVEGLLSGRGHQYLNGYESLDEIDVQVSFREPFQV
jgi:hypothetical protein